MTRDPESAGNSLATDTDNGPTVAPLYTILMVSLAVGLSSFLSKYLFIEAYTPRITRARKREMIETLLPIAVPMMALLAAAGFGLAVWRHRSAAKALWCNLNSTTLRVVRDLTAAALVLALSTPLLQKLCGLDPSVGWSRLFESAERIPMSVLALLGAALQEDVLVRWLPIEFFALMLGAFSTTPEVNGGHPDRRFGVRLIGPLAISVLFSIAVHAIQSGEPVESETWLMFGLPKAPGALAFAWTYWRLGAIPAVLLHTLTNLAILVLIPLLTAI